MCGFCGFTGSMENPNGIIENMMCKIVHRGPDSAGLYSDDFVTLGFRRLMAIEGIISPDGRILGKMGHSERVGAFVAKNIPFAKYQPLFEGGVKYFTD